MKNIAIYGAGGYGREVACLINAINAVKPQWSIIGFFDDGFPIGPKTEYGSVLGGIKELNDYPKKISVVMAIANSIILKKIVEQIVNPFIDFPNIIADDLSVGDLNTFVIGYGNIIGTRCSISCNVKIGNFNRFNYDVSLGHDDVIGSYNMFNPSTRISGEVTIGDCNFFGVNSIVLQQKKIGNNVTIGTHSVIIKKTKDGATYYGNPAIELKY